MPSNEAAAVVVPLALAAFSCCFFSVGWFGVMMWFFRAPRFSTLELRISIGSMVLGVVCLLVFIGLY